ncbi:MAG: transcriptional regulator, partial [Candidatus Micrarchaeota archaeon]
VTLSEKRFFGITEEWIGNLKFKISEREKTIVDCLYMPGYSGGLTEVAKAFREKLDYEKLYEYSVRMGDLATLKRLGFLLDALRIKTGVKEKLLSKVAGGYCLLDTCGPKTGPKSRKWRVVENIAKEELRLEL